MVTLCQSIGKLMMNDVLVVTNREVSKRDTRIRHQGLVQGGCQVASRPQHLWGSQFVMERLQGLVMWVEGVLQMDYPADYEPEPPEIIKTRGGERLQGLVMWVEGVLQMDYPADYEPEPPEIIKTRGGERLQGLVAWVEGVLQMDRCYILLLL